MISLSSGSFDSFLFNSYWLSHIVLPFIAFASAIYIGLIFMKWEKGPKAAISIVMSLTIVVGHIMKVFPYGLDPIEMMNRGLLMFGIIAFTITIILIIIGTFGAEPSKAFEGSFGLLILFLLCLLTYFFYPEIFPITVAPWFEVWSIMGFLFLIFIQFMTREDDATLSDIYGGKE